MPTTKLTLSADVRVVRKAKRLAKRRNTSVSAMFARYVENLAKEDDEVLAKVGPLTRRALGMVRPPEGLSDTELLEEALASKYGMR